MLRNYRKKQVLAVPVLVCLLTLLSQENVSAMHIMEGYLPPIWSLIWFIVFLPFFLLGIKEIRRVIHRDPSAKTMLALSGAFVFVLSSLKIPSVTGSSSHPTGVGLGTALFGPSVISVLGSICLLFQALLLAHGGITTLGANAFSMAVAGPFVGFASYRVARRLHLSQQVSLFLCAAFADLATYITTSVQLALVFPDPVSGFGGSLVKFLGVFLMTQIPIAIVEGLLTVVFYNLLSDSLPVFKEVFR
ncbi:energy-coupling factor ABC transporter permease [Streptococcus danieliae]|uniref:Cobalt transport protein CbiM n=1 Tax=Streptococcus danieliae TaxID=747656 RepID=A0A7X3G6K4_9STRE|nr:energy-coupling factor ABC transporter permease [Streptococcus danieliae]